ncbi:hypothetical protein DFH09DRAFT_907864 [Mycena vulgaris]|nr:hypothetical protein DFH09DRAFT_907864 [Mycena vulgaris]
MGFEGLLRGQPPPVLRPTVVKFAPPTELDILAKDALAASLTPDEALRRLYGLVTSSGNPVSVFIVSSKSKQGISRAAFSLYWGDGNARNSAYTFEGKQTDVRGSLFAVLKAVIDAPRSQPLTIFTPSQYAIHSFCYWAGENSTLGWPCTHGNVLEAMTDRIRQRTAPLEFRCVHAGIDNQAMAEAKLLAKNTLKPGYEGAPLVALVDLPSLSADTAPAGTALDLPKVYSSLPPPTGGTAAEDTGYPAAVAGGNRGPR